MDRLEEYIRKNREDLDRYSPSNEIWNRINRNIRKGRINRTRWLSAAAMIIVIFTTAALFYLGEDKRNFGVISRNGDALIMKANPDLKETEIYYNNLVNNLYNEATPLLTGYPDIEKELFSDLSQLDSICTDIKKDLKDNVANQEVIEALISNYRIKIHILEDMLSILKENENNLQKNDNHAL
jgi:hypothetical protein